MISLPRPMFVACILILVWVTSPLPARMARGAGDGVLDGRLGGTFGSFEAVYGTAAETDSGSGSQFAVDGYGLVSVQFNRTGGQPRPGDPAIVVTLSSPRPSGLPALRADEADWPREAALDRARAFLPTDVKLAEPADAEPGRAAASCTSPALEQRFGVLSLGQCLVTFVLPTPETVSYIVISMAGPADADAGGEPVPGDCTGMVAWSAATGGRLDAARSLLTRASAIDPTATDAVATLRELGSALGHLASDQRSAVAPAAAATANFYVISALTGYAEAVELAADATERDNAATMQKAVTGIDQANADVVSATDEIEIAVDDCGLSLDTGATPAATPSAVP